MLKGLVPKNKKGDFTDILIFVILLFILGVGLFVYSFVIPAISQGLLDGGLNTTVEGQAAIDTLTDYGSTGIQNGFLLLFVGMGLATIISSLFVRTHPALIFLYIVLLVLTIFIGTYLQNGYEQLANNAAFGNLINEQNSISTVFMNLHYITMGIGLISLIIVFGKFSSFGNRAGTGGSL